MIFWVYNSINSKSKHRLFNVFMTNPSPDVKLALYVYFSALQFLLSQMVQQLSIGEDLWMRRHSFNHPLRHFWIPITSYLLTPPACPSDSRTILGKGQGGYLKNKIKINYFIYFHSKAVHKTYLDIMFILQKSPFSSKIGFFVSSLNL